MVCEEQFIFSHLVRLGDFFPVILENEIRQGGNRLRLEKMFLRKGEIVLDRLRSTLFQSVDPEIQIVQHFPGAGCPGILLDYLLAHGLGFSNLSLLQQSPRFFEIVLRGQEPEEEAEAANKSFHNANLINFVIVNNGRWRRRPFGRHPSPG